MTAHKIIIVGSGFSGICMGIKLKQAGIHDFIILEKATELGGTWRENTYPGAECDIPSALYSYSFEPNPHWKHVWSKRNQIFQYQKDVAEKYNLMPHFRFGQRVTRADFQATKWCITTTENQYYAEHFISAIGQLHERYTPDIPGIDEFQGTQFHAAKWDHTVDLSGKRVAVIGAAASAVQLVPEVAKQALSLTVFQRTPNWMLPKPNRTYSRIETWLAKKLPILTKLYRNLLGLSADGILYPALNGNRLAAWLITKRVQGNLNKRIKDPITRAKLTPSYVIGAKRILFSHTFYEALNLDHVTLNTNAINRLTSNGIETQLGEHVNADVVIYATGFITNPFFKSIEVTGQKQTLANRWAGGAQGYLGIYTHGFPNMHMMYGPNTNLGHNSIIIMIEAQAKFIVHNIQRLQKLGKRTIDISQDEEESYNQELQQRLSRMAFSKIKHSWYMDNGKITNNWAGSTWEYRQKLASVDNSVFVLT